MAQLAYDNPNGSGTGGVFVPEIWSKEILLGLQASTFIPEIVTRYDTNVTSGGDKIHVPRIQPRTAFTRNALSVIAFTAVTETEFALNITTETIDAWEIRDLLSVQTTYDLRSRYTKESSKAIARKIDADVLNFTAAHTLVTLSIGNTANTTTHIAATYLSRAMAQLDAQNAVREDRYAVFEAIGAGQVLEVDNFVRWDATGKGDGPIITGKIGTYYGLNCMMNNNLATTTGTSFVSVGIAFQKSAIALAIQKQISSTAQYTIDSDSWKCLVKAIYGYDVAFTNAIVKINYGNQ